MSFLIQFPLFLGGNFSLPINPALLKFTLRLSAWPWTLPYLFSQSCPIPAIGVFNSSQWVHRGNTLRLGLNVAPSFSDFVVSADTPKQGVTSFHLLPPASAGRSMLVRLLNFAFAGEEGATKVLVSASANSTTSSLTITLPYFVGDLVYDPGMPPPSLSRNKPTHSLTFPCVGCIRLWTPGHGQTRKWRQQR
jgi:hypothetical protein